VCVETVYDAVYRGLILPANATNLRTSRTYRHRHGHGRSRDGALKQCTTMRSIHDRPAAVAARRQVGHWEEDLVRHEALYNRAEVKDLCRCAVAAV
jgi:IS30 family transposase